jgi:hypothetical protein
MVLNDIVEDTAEHVDEPGSCVGGEVRSLPSRRRGRQDRLLVEVDLDVTV